MPIDNDCVDALRSLGLSMEEAQETCTAAMEHLQDSTEHIFNAAARLDEEEQYVLGPVLIPNHLDSNGTMFPRSTVRNTAYNFMSNYQHNKFMHLLDLDEGDVSIVESYIAPVDMEIEGKTIKRGTWMMGVVVHNDTIWKHIKDGKIRGFSIGAHVKSKSLIIDNED